MMLITIKGAEYLQLNEINTVDLKRGVKGKVQHFGKNTYRESCWDLDEKTETNLMSVF